MQEKDKKIPASVVTALAQGNKIEAIKLLRESHGVGLKEAKDLVEEYLESHPQLQEQLNTEFAEVKHGLFRWIALIAVLSVAIYWFIVRQ